MHTRKTDATPRRSLHTAAFEARRTAVTAVVLLALLLVFAAQPARAYLEPGTGSLLMQTLFGLGVAAMMAVRVYWARIKGFFRALLKKTGSADGDADSDGVGATGRVATDGDVTGADHAVPSAPTGGGAQSERT